MTGVRHHEPHRVAPPPRGQDLTLALHVSKTEGRLPRCPRACAGGQALPIINLPQKMLGRKDGRRSHHHKFDVGNGHARPLHLFLSILQHVDVLRNAVRLDIILMHVGAEGNHVDGMKSPAVGVKEGDNFKGRHLRVEGVGILEVFEPDLGDGFSEEFGGPTLRRLVAGVVIEVGFVGCFCSNANDCGGVVRDATIVEWQLNGAFERIAAMVNGVRHCIRQDGREGVDTPKLVIGDLHQDREERLPD